MKAARLLRWSSSVLSPRTRPEPIRQICIHAIRIQCRTQSTAAATIETLDQNADESDTSQIIPEKILTKLPSPPVQASRTSAQLAALHARLGLPSKLPIESLARTLVHISADADSRFNNSSFSILGGDLLSFYTSEFVICQYPRLPLAVVFAAMNAYCGPKALATITREWGVKSAAEPGGEVEPSLLQFKHIPPGSIMSQTDDVISTRARPHPVTGLQRHSLSSRTVHDNAFGEKRDHPVDYIDPSTATTLETASAEFVRAVVGAVYLHAGRSAAKAFFKNHFMSRSLNMATLMSFRTPTKDLSRLCAREGFESPIARIMSETGRLSRHPVFIVGVFSGREKLGEGAGASLDEARTRAAVAALKGWYLYSPTDWRLPSDLEEPGAKAWTSQHVDPGDVL